MNLRTSAADSNEHDTPNEDGFDFLSVDRFLGTVVDARALKTALELGVVDHLADSGATSAAALGKALEVDAAGLRFLLNLLRANGVIDEDARRLRLTRRFRQALGCRDLLETKLDFAGFAMNDFADHFTEMVRAPASTAPKGRLFDLFDYRRCFQSDIQSYQLTKAWMRLTSTLTRYEAQACMRLYDFSRHSRMLDVGGNSGEFILQLCKVHPGLRGTVLDLPLVCEIGLEHVLGETEHDRISFIPGDVRNDPLPAGYDLISFKSMLHDWPEEDAGRFIAQAALALAPGGTLLIFERGPLDALDAVPPFSMLPILLFFRSYRPADRYVARLQALGLEAVQVQRIALDTPFFLVTARKPAH